MSSHVGVSVRTCPQTQPARTPADVVTKNAAAWAMALDLESSDGIAVPLPGDSELKCIAILTGKHVVVLSPSEVVLSPSEIPCSFFSPEGQGSSTWFATAGKIETIKELPNPIVLVCEDSHFSGTVR
jgi:hypothetical protein